MDLPRAIVTALAEHWIVERTFARPRRWRAMGRDYE
jgi:hypothetical protein